MLSDLSYEALAMLYQVALMLMAVEGGLLVAVAILVLRLYAQSQHEHSKEIKLAKRQAFIPIYDRLKAIRSVNPQDPNWEDVALAANALEFLAIAYKYKIAHRDILNTVYKTWFLNLYMEVWMAVDIEAGIERGKVILNEDCLTAVGLYKHWNK